MIIGKNPSYTNYMYEERVKKATTHSERKVTWELQTDKYLSKEKLWHQLHFSEHEEVGQVVELNTI